MKQNCSLFQFHSLIYILIIFSQYSLSYFKNIFKKELLWVDFFLIDKISENGTRMYPACLIRNYSRKYAEPILFIV